MSGQKIVTPAFVFDTAALRARAKRIKAALGRHKLCYAVKANPFLIGALLDIVDCFEVCSPGEYRICERIGVPAEKIVLSGVYKEEQDIGRIVDQCGARAVYTVESPSQLRLLGKLAQAKGLRLPICLRLSSGNQFGMDRETWTAALRESRSLGLQALGIQYYSGTQKKREKMDKEAEMLLSFAETLRSEEKFDCKRIEYGPGLGVSYFRSDAPVDEAELLQSLTAMFARCSADCEVVFETGRFLVAECGTYHTTVVDVKHTCDTNYCIVDGGIHHLNYYGQMMAMKLPLMRHNSAVRSHDAAAAEEKWTVCGSLCTTADVLVKSCPLCNLTVGDELVFEKTGAYSVTEGIYLFLSRDMPRIYMRTEDGHTILCRDAIRTDEINCIQ